MTLPPLARRKGKDIPRLPLSAFSPPNTAVSDTFPLPPTPSLVAPTGIADAHLQITTQVGGYAANTAHLKQAHKRALVFSYRNPLPEPIISSLQSLQSILPDARALAVLVPFSLEGTQLPEFLSGTHVPPLALATTYNGATPVAADAEEDTKVQAQVETPVKNLLWALQHSPVVDLDIGDVIIANNASVYDSLVNLLTKATKSETNTKRTPIVLTNLLLPPFDSVTPIVAMMNHPTYTTFRQRVSLLSLFENVYVKLLPQSWASTETNAKSDPKQEKDLRDIIKLFTVPVLEAFGFERIIFGSSPPSADGSPALAESWYRLVLESCRELAMSQDEMDKIFIDNAQRIYGST